MKGFITCFHTTSSLIFTSKRDKHNLKEITSQWERANIRQKIQENIKFPEKEIIYRCNLFSLKNNINMCIMVVVIFYLSPWFIRCFLFLVCRCQMMFWFHIHYYRHSPIFSTFMFSIFERHLSISKNLTFYQSDKVVFFMCYVISILNPLYVYHHLINLTI